MLEVKKLGVKKKLTVKKESWKWTKKSEVKRKVGSKWKS